ncbi:hypothetical protein D3C78_1292450 [compost metagenome]
MQPCGNGQGALVQGAIADIFLLVTFTQQAHMETLRLLAYMPVQYFDQGLRCVRRLRCCCQGLDGVAGGQRTYGLGAMSAVQHVQHVGGGVCRGEQVFR